VLENSESVITGRYCVTDLELETWVSTAKAPINKRFFESNA